MGSKIPTLTHTVQYEGLFDFDGLYGAIVDWAKNYGFMWHEQDYKHKVPNPFGAEQQLKWQMDKRLDPYVKYTIALKVHIWEMVDVEVNVGGKTKTLTKARLYIRVNGTVELDWQNKFSKGGKFGRWLGGMYAKIYTHDISGQYWDTLVYRVYDLQHVLKAYFDMQSKKYTYKGYVGDH